MKIIFDGDITRISLTRMNKEISYKTAVYGETVKHDRFDKEMFVVITPLTNEEGPTLILEATADGLYELSGEGYIFYDVDKAREFFKEQNEKYRGQTIVFDVYGLYEMVPERIYVDL